MKMKHSRHRQPRPRVQHPRLALLKRLAGELRFFLHRHLVLRHEHRKDRDTFRLEETIKW